METTKIPLEHFTTLDGWTLETEIDEKNKVFHVTISNQNGDIVDAEGGEFVKEATISFALVEDEDLIEDEDANE